MYFHRLIRYFLIFIFVLRAYCLSAQAPAASFQVKPTACLEESLEVLNTSVNGVSYEWDFCLGDIRNFKQSNFIATVSGLSSGTHYKLVETDGVWFAFVSSYDNNKIYRLDFGTDLNATPIVNDLGNFGGLIEEPYSIDVNKVGGMWYGFVGSLQTNFGVTKLEFGSTLTNTPLATNIGNFGFSTNYIDLQLVQQGADVILALVANGVLDGNNDASVVTVNFGNSVNNAPISIVSAPIPNAGNTLRGFEIVNKQGNWFGFFTSSTGSKLIRIDFGSNIQSVIFTGVTHTFPSIIAPFDVTVIQEGSRYFAIVANLSVPIAILDFAQLTASSPTELSNSSLPVLFSVAATRIDGKTFVQGASLSNKISHLIFEAPCQSSVAVSKEQYPALFAYASSGPQEIELVVKGANANESITGESVTISANFAADISFTTDEVNCSSVPITFTSQNVSGDIVTYQWSFGDATFANGGVVQHAYLQGDYKARLDVTASNGCTNFYVDSVNIYNPPISTFTPPSGLICTNNEFTFHNTTVDNFDGNLSYQWLVDDVPTSTQRDLLHTFVTGGDKEITLQASIPGCSSEMIQLLPGVGEGPIVDFAVEGVCLNETIQMTNASSGDIASYAWDFGDGQTSAEASPAIDYTSIGEYSISLEALGNNGCVSTKTLNHQVFSVPQPNFNTDLPPFSCSGSPTQFNDLTPVLVDSNLESWLWTFGDNETTGSGQSPQHTYALSGLYDVTLQVTSDKGCTNQLTKSVSIAESPVATINNSPACVNTGMELLSSSTTPLVGWEWKVENNLYYTENPSHVFASPGTYNVNLLVTGENGCLGSSFKQVVVPVPATIDFTSVKKCVDTDAQFHATATDSPDLAASYAWLMNDVEKQGQNVTYAFPAAGLYEVVLSVTTESGCVYTINKAQTVIENPQADFAFSPARGAPPLLVQFTNNSANATSYNWRFNDVTDATSSLVSPSFTFTEVGDYAVDLLVSNEEGCESIISKLVKVEFPLLYVSLVNFETIEGSNGLLQMQVTLNNQGNVDVPLFEKVAEILPGGESRTVVLSTGLSQTSGLQFLCLNLQLENNAPGANEELCLSLEESTIFTTPYPNPAKDILKLEWIADRVEDMNLSVVNSLGKEMLSISFAGQQGLNSHSLSTQLWQEGLYFVKVQSPSVERTFRIIIVR